MFTFPLYFAHSVLLRDNTHKKEEREKKTRMLRELLNSLSFSIPKDLHSLPQGEKRRNKAKGEECEFMCKFLDTLNAPQHENITNPKKYEF